MLYSLLRSGGDLSFLNIVLMLVSYAVLILVMLPVHEFAHAATAHWLGDYTPKAYGRLTLNPKAHLDPWGAIMLVLCGFGYAKPVAVNPYNFRRMKPKGGMAVTALAGPLSNLLMAYAALLVFRIYLLISGGDILTAGNTVYLDSELTKYLYLIFVDVFAGINIGLAVFNLLPIPPLDGSRIFSVLLPDKWVFALERYSRYITMGIFVLLFTGVLDVPLDFLRHWIGGLLCLLTGLPNLFCS